MPSLEASPSFSSMVAASEWERRNCCLRCSVGLCRRRDWLVMSDNARRATDEDESVADDGGGSIADGEEAEVRTVRMAAAATVAVGAKATESEAARQLPQPAGRANYEVAGGGYACISWDRCSRCIAVLSSPHRATTVGCCHQASTGRSSTVRNRAARLPRDRHGARSTAS